MEWCTSDELRKFRKLWAFCGRRKVTLDEAMGWLMDRHYYLMAMPEPYYRWSAWVCVLGIPNTQDGRLNACRFEKLFDRREDALHYGLGRQLDILIDAEEKASGMTKAEADALLEECRKEGWDV